jgi:hypothetical protein
VCVCMHVCMHVFMRACVRACAYVRVYVSAARRHAPTSVVPLFFTAQIGVPALNMPYLFKNLTEFDENRLSGKPLRRRNRRQAALRALNDCRSFTAAGGMPYRLMMMDVTVGDTSRGV